MTVESLFPDPIHRICGNCGAILEYPAKRRGSPHFTGVRWSPELGTSVSLWTCEADPDLVAQREREVIDNAHIRPLS